LQHYQKTSQFYEQHVKTACKSRKRFSAMIFIRNVDSTSFISFADFTEKM